jgi:hypothetical protein
MHSNEPDPRNAPATTTHRTSYFATSLATGIAANPPTKKKNVVADEIEATDQPSSLLNACRYTDKP